MSGGHFDYVCFRISQFAGELKHEIDINNDVTQDHYGDPIGAGLGPETITRLVVAQQIIETAGKLAREVEWLYSGDHGDESFCKLVDKIFGDVE